MQEGSSQDGGMIPYQDSAWNRNVVNPLLSVPTAADALPLVPRAIVTNGKWTALSVFIGWLAITLLWLPFWIFSLLVTETGIYVIAVGSVFTLGRAIIRLIAFPGSSKRIYGEIEAEFARYSVRMLESGTSSLIELAELVQSDTASTSLSAVPGLWKRAISFKHRVFGVFSEVLMNILAEDNISSLDRPDLTNCRNAYGNNRLVGDVGNLTGVSAQAKSDGIAASSLINRVLLDMQEFEESASDVLNSSIGSLGTKSFSSEAMEAASKLLKSAKELRDILPSLRPPNPETDAESLEEDGIHDDEGARQLKSMRHTFEEQGGTAMEAIKSGVAQILPLLDPPPHESIFGLDVLRGCMLSRFIGARQIWVPRVGRSSGNGMLDVVQIPAVRRNNEGPSKKAVLYCNPNAGLFEVSTGISLSGGNVEDTSQADGSWTDFYTENGYDIFLFNYAGYGRSYGGNFCWSGKGSATFNTNVTSRLKRIFLSGFVTFKPTPGSLKEDAVAVARFIMNDGQYKSLVLHGESIGGMAAAGAAKALSVSSPYPAVETKLSLLICDRTFCNLPAVAQRLVGGWSGPAIRALAPLWDTDVAGEFVAAACPKIVANDAADAMISNSSSLQAGLAFSGEVGKGSTNGAGAMMDTPVAYRMADWADSGMTEILVGKVRSGKRVQAPIWPRDKHVSLEESFHFAACLRRIGKVATAGKRAKRESNEQNVDEKGIEMSDSICHSNTDDVVSQVNSPSNALIDVWNVLSCCDGLCGSPLGAAVKDGYDVTVSWLCSTLSFGGQVVVANAEKRIGNTNVSNGEFVVMPSDFDCRLKGYAIQEDELRVHPIPIPEVLDTLRALVDGDDGNLRIVEHECRFCVSVFEYIFARLSSTMVVASSRQAIHFHEGTSSLGTFLNLHCGHNNAYSAEERSELLAFLNEACGP